MVVVSLIMMVLEVEARFSTKEHVQALTVSFGTHFSFSALDGFLVLGGGRVDAGRFGTSDLGCRSGLSLDIR